MQNTKRIIGILIALLLVLVAEMVLSLYHIANYDSQKAAGNERWKQVEQRIVQVETKINEIENKI